MTVNIPPRIAADPERICSEMYRRITRAEPPCAQYPTELFDLPKGGSRELVKQLTGICLECPVLEECRIYTDIHEKFKISPLYFFAGGESPHKRGVRRKKYCAAAGGTAPFYADHKKRGEIPPVSPSTGYIPITCHNDARTTLTHTVRKLAMDITVYKNLEQGSDEWLQARCGIVTASIVGKLLTPTGKPASNEAARTLRARLIAERYTGHSEHTPQTFDMWRGSMDEPLARDLYAKHYAPVTEVGFMTRRDGDAVGGYSPDGLVGDDGLIEIKSKKPHLHMSTLLTGEVPTQHMAQLQMGLWVSGRDWIDYVQFSGGMPLFVTRVYPDIAWQDAIEGVLTDFCIEAEDTLQRLHELDTLYPITTERPYYYDDTTDTDIEVN